MTAATTSAGGSSKGNAVILIGVLIVFALILGGFGIAKYRKGEASRSWPTVEGRITDARVDSTRSDDKTVYQPRVSYSYSVDGTQRVGHSISVISSYSSRGKAEAVLGRYPVGTVVAVHYDPESPGSSLLEPGAGSDAVMILAAAVGCLVLAVVILVSALRRGGSAGAAP